MRDDGVADLEPVPVEGALDLPARSHVDPADAPAAPRKPAPLRPAGPRRPRWPWALLAGALVFALTFHVAQSRRAIGRVEAALAGAEAAVAESRRVRVEVISSVESFEELAPILRALYAEQIRVLLDAQDAAGRVASLDPGIRRARESTVRAIAARVRQARVAAQHWAAPRNPESQPALDAEATRAVALAADRVEAQRRRWHRSSARPTGRRLPDAAAELERLRRYVDEPTGGVRLLLSGDRGYRLVDLDNGRSIIVELGREGFFGAFASTSRGSWAALAVDGGLAIVDATGDRTALVPLTFVQAVVPAARADAVVIQVSSADDDGSDIIEVDRTGRTRARLGHLESGQLRAVTAGGWVIDVVGGGDIEPPNLRIVDPATGAARRDLPDRSRFVDAHGRTLAWAACDPAGPCALWLTDVVTGEDRLVASPLGATVVADAGAFSPDGRQLAVAYRSSRETGTAIGFVDVAAGTAALGEREIDRSFQGFPIVWSPTGDRVFFSTANGNGLAFQRPGELRPTRVRLGPLRLGRFATVAALRSAS